MSSFGGSIKLTGETEYQRALKGITQSLRETSSELKVVTSAYDKNDKSTSALSSKSQVLSKQLEQQKTKVQIMKDEYNRLSQSEDENSVAMSRLRTQINQAQTDINKTTKEIDNLGKETDETTESVKKSGEGFTVFKGILANLGTQAINSAINGLKSLGSSLVNVGKQALDSYADYEQLIGGVETLFKDSAPIVEKYANNAYKTAGLSANEYMETVTSFSASLLQSLDNDTKKAAEYSNRAVTDMSDNANKMGTNIGMIQNAYQGFAKQNYTMLDNLKLGYGGTKEEMARLIKDASKMTDVQKELGLTVDGSSMSFGNIVNAISVVQKKMGIMGTTSKEAASTISGSVSSMKSAWQNMLTGIADDNADFEALVKNLVDSIGTALNNLLPRVQVIIEGIFNLITTLVPKLFPQILTMINDMLPKIITSITDALPKVVDSISKVIPMIVQTLISMLPQILECGIKIIVSLVQGLAQSMPTLIPAIVEAVLLMSETLLDNIDLIVDAGIELIIGLSEGLIEALPQLIDKIPIIIDKLIMAITNNLPKIIEMGITLTVKLAEGLIKAIPQLVAKIPQIIGSLVKGIANYYSKIFSVGGELLGKVKDGIVSGISGMLDVGKQLVQGLWNGINNAKDWVLNKVKGFGSAILGGIKSIFGIHSPSTVFRDEIGKNLALGIGEGFSDEMSTVTKDMQNAIPTNFETDSMINETNGNVIGTNSYFNVVEAFKDALSQMKIELDDENMGKFIDKTVSQTIFT